MMYVPRETLDVLNMSQEAWLQFLKDLFYYRDGFKNTADVINSVRTSPNATLRMIEDREKQIAKLQEEVDKLKSYLSDEGREQMEEYYAKAYEYNERIKVYKAIRTARSALTTYIDSPKEKSK